jgi:transposase
MCELLVGLPEVSVLGVVDVIGDPLRVHVEMRTEGRRCGGCGAPARVKERPEVELVDLPVFGRQARLLWRKHRLMCVQAPCPVVSWTVENPAIAPPRLALTDRAGRWVTEQVGRWGRTVNEVAVELGCDWHTINDAVIA